MAGRNCCNSIMLPFILLTNLDSVIDKCQTAVMSTTCYSPTDSISDRMLIVCSGVLSHLVDGYAYSRSFCRFSVVITVNIFSSLNKMVLTSLGACFFVLNG